MMLRAFSAPRGVAKRSLLHREALVMLLIAWELLLIPLSQTQGKTELITSPPTAKRNYEYAYKINERGF